METQKPIPVEQLGRAHPHKRTLQVGLLLFCTLFCLLPIKGTQAAEVLRRIEFRGATGDLGPEFLRGHIKSAAGQAYSPKVVREDVTALFATGFFSNIQVRFRKGVLVYELSSRNAITKIVFKGNYKIKHKDLIEKAELEGLDKVDSARIKNARQKIKQAYIKKGFLLASVRHSLVPVKKTPSSFRLVFYIKEGKRAYVERLEFFGNKNLPSKLFTKFMATKKRGALSFLSQSGLYDPEVLAQDHERLKFLYMEEGYLNAQVREPQVFITPDKSQVHISVHITEGEQYEVGNMSYASDALFAPSDLREGALVETGDVFSYSLFQEEIKRLEAKYGDKGHAFVNVIPQTRINERLKQVEVRFEFERGDKVFVRRVLISGNDKTRDNVIRREIKVPEGSLYNETLTQQSLASIRSLGFFEEVTLNRLPVPGDPTGVNLEFKVKERSTGSGTVGLGYSGFAGFSLNGSLNQRNFLGKGQFLELSANFGKDQSLWSVNFYEPSWKDLKWSYGFEAYRRKQRLADYDEVQWGGGFRVGYPLGPYLRALVGYTVEHTAIELSKDLEEEFDATGKAFYPYESIEGRANILSASLDYTRLNDALLPTKGWAAHLGTRYAGLGGPLKYTSVDMSLRWYKPLFWKLVLRNRLRASWLRGLNGQVAPFNQRYHLGGPTSLRGYDWFSVGTMRCAYRQTWGEGVEPDPACPPSRGGAVGVQRVYGGLTQVLGNWELERPLIESGAFTGLVFFDMGQARDSFAESFKNLRYNGGVGVRWRTPLGLLHFSVGWPLFDSTARGAQTHFYIGEVF